MKYVFLIILFIALPISAMQVHQIPEELKKRKLYAQDFQALGIEYITALRTNLDVSKIIARKRSPFVCLENQRKEYTQQVVKEYQAPIYLKYINDTVGFGVFADKPIKECDTISEYTGYLCVEDDSNEQVECMDYAIDVGNFYDSQRGTALYVNAEKAGNFTRFINHSYLPNVCSLSVYNEIDRLWHVMMLASKDIDQDTQLLTNYGTGYWDVREIVPIDLQSNP